jgi:tetratricopeptide (TPR) repeat protein
VLIGWSLAQCAPAADFDLIGHIVPEAAASVSLHGATAPFESATLSDERGRFRFRKLAPGAYTLAVFQPARGEARQTVEVGPGVADSAGRVKVTLRLESGKFESDDPRRRSATVSTLELSIPAQARQEYREAQRCLSRRDVACAVAHLHRAVEIAPRFAAAWNHLGTIAYQGRNYKEAEDNFRHGLAADPQAFEPLVNLGGVLLNLGRVDEALQHNLHAALRRPNDALANAQLGMSYFLSGNLDLAAQYLTLARQTDPAHFSHPQLLLSEIHLRRNERAAAIQELEDFLRRHPDAPEAPEVKSTITRLKE